VKKEVDASRPTAVNLMWATARIQEISEGAAALPGATAGLLREKVLAEALALAEEDVAINTAIAKHGAEVVPHGANVLHHCNTGALATVDVGTALGVIYGAWGRGESCGWGLGADAGSSAVVWQAKGLQSLKAAEGCCSLSRAAKGLY